MKKCKHCGESKDLCDFPKAKSTRDGRTNKCKKCTGEYLKKWKQDNPDKINKPLTEVAKDRNRIRAREWYKNNTEKAKLRNKKWRQENPDKFNKYRKTWLAKNEKYGYLKLCKYRTENPIKYHAHCMVRNEVNKGTLISPEGCSVCGNKGYIVAHHDDYSKPLCVRWLCQKCHMDWHSKNEALNNDK